MAPERARRLMLAVEASTEDTAAGLWFADTLEDLSLIRREDCAATIWRRQMPGAFQAWINTLGPDQLPRARVIRRPSEMRESLVEICEAHGMPDGPERALFIDDAADLAATFAEVTGAPYLRLRFDVITNNACRKFHIDTLTARLICTYRGTGTQYGHVSEQDDPQTIYTVPAGSPIVLRGRLWPEQPNVNLRHRSPPIEGTGETRLVLVLDPMMAPEDAYSEVLEVTPA